jgi:phytoene synthase
MTAEAAYAFCRAVAKREAKNFYYAFRVLPRPKSDALCAVYAFMRRADDIADDESKSIETRRTEMAEWLAAWRGMRETGGGEDPVFVALSHAQRAFSIPVAWLEDLVRGTSMDLEPNAGQPGASIDIGDGLQGYATFPDLYRYCFLVASVVGLVCIRIFGYSDPAAELLAEKTGVAFQLTNILRDVKEDAERGRIYLPQEMLREFGVTNAELIAMVKGAPLRAKDRAMIVALSVQAWEFYAAADALLPLIDPDSRGALWVLVEIYSGLLGKIDRLQGDVFSKRASVPTPQKVLALVRGALISYRVGRR